MLDSLRNNIRAKTWAASPLLCTFLSTEKPLQQLAQADEKCLDRHPHCNHCKAFANFPAEHTRVGGGKISMDAQIWIYNNLQDVWYQFQEISNLQTSSQGLLGLSSPGFFFLLQTVLVPATKTVS